MRSSFQLSKGFEESDPRLDTSFHRFFFSRAIQLLGMEEERWKAHKQESEHNHPAIMLPCREEANAKRCALSALSYEVHG